jgi:hypothetical protein
LNEDFCISKNLILPLEDLKEKEFLDPIFYRWVRDEEVIKNLGLENLRRWFDIVNQKEIRACVLKRQLKENSVKGIREKNSELLKSLLTSPYQEPPHKFTLSPSFFLLHVFLSSFIHIFNSSFIRIFNSSDYKSDSDYLDPFFGLSYYIERSSLLSDCCSGIIPESVVIGEKKLLNSFFSTNNRYIFLNLSIKYIFFYWYVKFDLVLRIYIISRIFRCEIWNKVFNIQFNQSIQICE